MSSRRWYALGGIFGPAGFVAAWTIGGLVASGYSPVDDAISRLAEIGAPTRGLMTAGFVAFGVGVLLYSVALRAVLAGGSWVAAAVSALATLGVAAAPLGRSSSGDAVHGWCAGLGYVALALTPLLAAGPLGRAGRPAWARSSIAAGTAAAILLAASAATPWNGLFQRAGLTVVDVWIVTTAVEIFRGRWPARPPEGRRS